MINNNQRKKENTALSEGSLEPRSSLDNATIDREKGTKDVDNHADVNSKMTNKPLIEELRKYIVLENDIQNMKYIELSYTGELIPFEIVEGKFAEAVKKLKEELCLGCMGKGCSNCEEIDKIMGNFK